MFPILKVWELFFEIWEGGWAGGLEGTVIIQRKCKNITLSSENS